MRTLYARIATALVALLAVAAVAMTGCSQSAEGDRCNPNLAKGESDCNSGLTCTVPPACPEAYCCPTNSDGSLGKSSNPYCQTGCNGGAASACNGGDVDACAFACSNDPGDLLNPDASCPATPPLEAGPETSTEAGPVQDGAAEASKPADGGAG